jgi:23S rRNA pseudouridine1911/1915/1917 synthase
MGWQSDPSDKSLGYFQPSLRDAPPKNPMADVLTPETSDFGFDILFEDGPCLAVCKPPGLPTQAPPGIDSLEVRIKTFLNRRDNPPHDVYLGVPHRLDRPASGAMVFATRRRAAHRLARQFELRTVEKTYWALVAGRVDPPAGTWRDFLMKTYGKPQAEVVGPDHPDGRAAILHYKTLQENKGISWLEIRLETGRTHQVRVQAASRGHPILGDVPYGSTIPFGPQHEDQRLRAIALHARLLEFDHPVGRRRISVTATTPELWNVFLA